MKVLFLLEPVIFRQGPALIAAHLSWVECVRKALSGNDGELALVGNPQVWDAWNGSDIRGGNSVVFFPVNAFETLAGFNYERTLYAQNAFSQPDEDNPLVTDLARIRDAFEPQLVIMTTENAMARQAFAGLPFLFFEQAPLPQLGHPVRTAIDPTGIQRDSLLERQADRIRRLPLDSRTRAQAGEMLQTVMANIAHADPVALSAQQALQRFRSEGRVALLVTQPTDGVSYEGAYHAIELENVLSAWAEALPPGWIGVPTYHAGQSLDPVLEAALAKASSRLRFLPPNLSQNLTEPLLLAADGMVTISSASAMTGLLMRKPVVVTEKTAFSAWCPSEPSQLAQAAPLSEDEAVSTFCFLTNRYAHNQKSLMENPAYLSEILYQTVDASDRDEWFLDPAAWEKQRAERLFKFRICGLKDGTWSSTCERPALEAQLESLRMHNESLRQEWSAAVAQRDRADLARELALSERDTFRQQWAEAVADRDRVLAERDRVAEQLEALRREAAEQRQQWVGIEKALAVSQVRGDAWREELASLSEQARDRALESTALQLQNDRASARLDELELRVKRLRERLEKKRSAYESLHLRCLTLTASKESLTRELAASRSNADALRSELDEAVRQSALQTHSNALLSEDERNLRAEHGAGRADIDLLQRDAAELRLARDGLRDEVGSLQKADGSLRQQMGELRRQTEELLDIYRSLCTTNTEQKSALDHANGDKSEAAIDTPLALARPGSDGTANDEATPIAVQERLVQLQSDLVMAVAEREFAWEQCASAIRERGRLTRELFLAASERDEAQRARVAMIDHAAALQSMLDTQRGKGGAYEQQARELIAKVERCREELNEYRTAVLQSTSWRLTAPVRWVRELVGGSDPT